MDPYAELVRLRNQRGGAPVNPARAWYRIENHSSPVKADVYVFDIIGNDPFFGGISAAAFGEELRSITAKNVALHINSLGGDVFEGVAMRNAIAQHPATFDTRIEGVAASTASWIGLGVNGKVSMAPQSTMFIHEPFNLIVGDAEMMRKAANELDMFGGQIADMYVAKAGGTRDEWRGKMRDATWFTDETAVAAKLADEVMGAAAPQNSVTNLIESTLARLIKVPPRNAAGSVTLTADQLAQIGTYLDAIEANAEAADASVDAIEVILGIGDEPEEVTNHIEARRAELIYLRDESRRLGVA